MLGQSMRVFLHSARPFAFGRSHRYTHHPENERYTATLPGHGAHTMPKELKNKREEKKAAKQLKKAAKG